MFDRAGIEICGIQKAVGPTVKVLAAARKMGIKIIYLKMGYKPDLSDLGAPNSANRVRHLRLGVGEKITAPDGNESRILIRDALEHGHRSRTRAAGRRRYRLQDAVQRVL